MNTTRLKARWQNNWQTQAKRIDALSLRERVFLFLSIALVLAAVLDQFLIAPLTAEQTQARQNQQRQATELKTLRQQFAEASQLNAADSPQGQLRAAIRAAQGETLELDQQLQQRSGLLDNQSQLPEVMGRLLRQHERLSLVNLHTLDEAALPQSSSATQSSLKWRGVELQVSGDYLDLMRYLAELEAALPTLRWGQLRLSHESGRALLQLQVFLVGGRA
ncbi:MAG: type II secretion system protein M [Burkholderiaceae bacterium]|nr:type II secretion system protein M [Burkholderiaceae bacterium]